MVQMTNAVRDSCTTGLRPTQDHLFCTLTSSLKKDLMMRDSWTQIMERYCTKAICEQISD